MSQPRRVSVPLGPRLHPEAHLVVRQQPAELLELHDSLLASATVNRILEAADVMLLVVNRHRQIIVANRDLLAAVGAVPEDVVVGQRPGEVLTCVNAWTRPTGCGTSERCTTCGAAIAILASQHLDRPAEGECLLMRRVDGVESCLEMHVRAVPLNVDGEPMTVVSLRDLSHEKRRQALERTFFHDLLNTLGAMCLTADNLRRVAGDGARELGSRLAMIADQLREEIEGQRALLLAEEGELRVVSEPHDLCALIETVREVAASHPAAVGRSIDVATPAEEVRIATDGALVVRIVLNLVKNALEATSPGGSVRITLRLADGVAVVTVWNEGTMPEDVAAQVFKRSFSTKGGPGRGLGTYSARLFAERYLNGSVTFESTAERGTEFRVAWPI